MSSVELLLAAARAPSATAPSRGPRRSRRADTTGNCAPISRWRASASATRDVSIVIQRRPHCSATIRGRARAARRVEDQIAGIGAHQHAALDDLRVASGRRRPCRRRMPADVSSQTLVERRRREVVEVADVAESLSPIGCEPAGELRAAPCPSRFVFQPPVAGRDRSCRRSRRERLSSARRESSAMSGCRAGRLALRRQRRPACSSARERVASPSGSSTLS